MKSVYNSIGGCLFHDRRPVFHKCSGVALRRNKSNIDHIITIYKTDFDRSKLKLHRTMFYNIVEAKKIEICNLKR